jgi:dTDP-4-amino-4,6-dideoxygalactose transaminase
MVQIQQVPFLDLRSQIEPLRTEILESIHDVIARSEFILGERLEAFEGAFARYCDCRQAVGVASGTDALYLALRAHGVGPGDEVITAPNMFIAAVEAIIRTGATPVLADVRIDTFCIDPEWVERVITPRTRAIIPVHLFGLPCDMDALMEIAERHALFVVEDACQAHGASYKGSKAGSLGHAAAFSFYPTKNLGGMGDGGAVTTNDEDIASRVRMLRHHGQRGKNVHHVVGENSRLDGIQAAVLSVKLPHLDAWNERRRAIAARYRSRLEGTDYQCQVENDGVKSSYHILGVRHPRRRLVHEQLDQSKIGWGNHIAMPIHLQPGYRSLGYTRGSFPISERLCEEIVSLPVSPTLTDAQVDYVINALGRVEISV